MLLQVQTNKLNSNLKKLIQSAGQNILIRHYCHKYKLFKLSNSLMQILLIQPIQFTDIMSTFYGHNPKIYSNKLLSYIKISSFLQLKQITYTISQHLITYSYYYDILQLYEVSVLCKNEQLKGYIQTVLFQRNFEDIDKRKQEIMKLDEQTFFSLFEYISKNIKFQTTLNWRIFNNLIMKFSNTKSKPQLYLNFRQSLIHQNDLTAQQYSLIFGGQISLLPKPHQTNKMKLSGVFQTQSVILDNKIMIEFNKMIQLFNSNNQRYQKLNEKINELEEKNQIMEQSLKQSNKSIFELKHQINKFQRTTQIIYRIQEPQNSLCYSQSKPFLQNYESQKTSDRIISQNSNSSHLKHSNETENKNSTQDSLTFSEKPASLNSQQIVLLQKVLGIDVINKGHLNLIYKAVEDSSKQQFLQSINGKQNLIFLIQVFQDYKNIGIFTSSKINSRQQYNEDYQSYIFSLNNGLKYKTMDPSKSIMFDQDHLISFSTDLQFSNDVLNQMSKCRWPVTYQSSKNIIKDNAKQLVGNEDFYASEFEVFQLIWKEVKMQMQL